VRRKVKDHCEGCIAIRNSNNEDVDCAENKPPVPPSLGWVIRRLELLQWFKDDCQRGCQGFKPSLRFRRQLVPSTLQFDTLCHGKGFWKQDRDVDA